MEIDAKFIFLIIGLVLLLISFILQCILCGLTSFKSIKDLIPNWKKIPIIGFSLSNNDEGFNKNDYFQINSTKIYIKRMDEKYNLLYLNSRTKNQNYEKKCGNNIYFKEIEECPINYVNLSKEYEPNEKYITLNISDSVFFEFSNDYINNKIIVDIYYNKSSNNLKIENYYSDCEFSTKDGQMVISINSRLKYNNIAILIIFIFYIALIIVVIFNKNIHVFYVCYFILIIFSITLIILCSLGIVWRKEVNSLLPYLGCSDYDISKRIFNIEKTIISFIIFFSVIIFIFLPLTIELKNDIRCGMLFLFFLIIILLSPIIGFIITILKTFFNTTYFKNLKLNYQMSPITDIQISNYSNIINNKDSSYFNPKLPYRLNYKYNYEKSDFNDYLTKWKGYSFYVTRMNKKYTYPYIYKYKSKYKKLCGLDSMNHSLYFPENVECPINYIEFNESSIPLIEGYKWVTKKINNNTYMHYSNEFTKYKIVVDLRIDINYTDDNNNYSTPSSSYDFLDIDEKNNSNNQLILYSRTYANFRYMSPVAIMKIRNIFLSYIIIYLISYLLIYFFTTLMILIRCGILDLSNTYFTSFSCINLILSIIEFIITLIYMKKYSKILEELSYKERDKYDDGLTIFIYLLYPIFIIVFFCFVLCNIFKNEYDCISIDKKDFLNGFKVFIFIPFIIFPILILFKELYNEGYVDSIIDNWKKNPIMDIEINELNSKDSIGFFKNFNGELSQNIYKWKGKSFNFKRLEKKYIYPKIINNIISNYKSCGKDNQNNTLYLEKGKVCPINYIEITNNTKPTLENWENYNCNNKSIGNYNLFYCNNYTEGEILIDLKVSNIKGPCLNKKKNNDICSFYIEKCDLKEKDYACDTNSSYHGFNKIDNESIFQLIKDNNLNTVKHFDNTSIVYLYKETYIGFSKLNNLTIQKSGKIFHIKKFNHSVNIVLFIYMIFFVIRLIFIFVIEDLEGFKYLFLCLFYLIFTLICFILKIISIIQYFIISKNVFRFFENELSHFYEHTKWQIVLEILMLIYDIIIIILIIYELIKNKSLYERRTYRNPIYYSNPIVETEYIQITGNLRQKLKNLKQKEIALKNEYEENKNILREETDEKFALIRKSIYDVAKTDMNLNILIDEKEELNTKMQNLENEKDKLQEMINNLENLENEIENLNEDIKEEEEEKINLKQIHDIYNKEYISIYQKRHQSS